jgi:hypothetical protein
MREGAVNDEYDQDIKWLADWLTDPDNAQACAKLPIGPELGASPGIYGWHGDEVATELVINALGPVGAGPLYLGRTSRAMNKRIIRDHMRNTKVSTLRRSLAAILWDELDLRCPAPNTIDPVSESRLTLWMIEHLSVTAIPIGELSNIPMIEADVLEHLDPPLNLNKVGRTPSRTKLRALRRQHLGVTSDTAEWARQLLALHAAEATDPGVVVPITIATGRGSRRSRARAQTCWRPVDAKGGA